MDTITRSWALAKESYQVLRRVPSLILFPILSSIATIIISISFFVPVYVITGGKELQKVRPEIGYPLMFGFYFLSYFVVIFFNSAMVACAYEGLQGRGTTFAYGMSVARSRLGAILGWTGIAATVGVVLRTIAERTGLIGNIVVGIIGFVWNVGTYFVVPVLVIEKGSPVACIKKSTAMLKQTWGERVVASVGMGSVMGLFCLLGLIPVFGGVVLATSESMVALGIALMAFGIIYILVVATIAAALQGIFQTALYVYAETGTVPNGFNPASVQGAFKPKEGVLSKFQNRF